MQSNVSTAGSRWIIIKYTYVSHFLLIWYVYKYKFYDLRRNINICWTVNCKKKTQLPKNSNFLSHDVFCKILKFSFFEVIFYLTLLVLLRAVFCDTVLEIRVSHMKRNIDSHRAVIKLHQNKKIICKRMWGI